jgi:hypothetical protein
MLKIGTLLFVVVLLMPITAYGHPFLDLNKTMIILPDGTHVHPIMPKIPDKEESWNLDCSYMYDCLIIILIVTILVIMGIVVLLVYGIPNMKPMR